VKGSLEGHGTWVWASMCTPLWGYSWHTGVQWLVEVYTSQSPDDEGLRSYRMHGLKEKIVGEVVVPLLR